MVTDAWRFSHLSGEIASLLVVPRRYRYTGFITLLPMSFAVVSLFTLRRYISRYRVFEQSPSNQAMKLTATAMRFGDAFRMISFLLPQIGLCPRGRSLSFSR